MQIPPLLLDRARDAPLAIQLADQLRDAIRQGCIAAGARLPSSRQLADQLCVARNTVVRAYDALGIEGYVETRSASGVFAATPRRAAAPLVAPIPLATDLHTPLPPQMPGPMHAHRAQNLLGQDAARLAYDFLPGRPRASLFPVKAWRRLLQSRLAYGGGVGLSQYGDPGGLLALRAAITAHLAYSRGIVVDPEQVLIVAGIQEGLNIAARLFLSPGSVALTEDPCYQGATYALQAAGARVLGVPVDDEGLVADALPQDGARLLYLTPSHQYPTGQVLSQARRHAVIAWARRTGCHLLEDDYDGEFQYEGSALPAIASLAPDCCIYLGTFSKTLGAGLRIGYMVVPPRLVAAVRDAKALLNNGNPWLDQATLAEFIRSGSYAAHVTRCRAHYLESRDALVAALRRHFGDVRISGERSGMHLFWHLPAGVPEAARLAELALRARVGVYPPAAAAVHTDAGDASLGRRALVLGYATLLPRQIEQGIARLSDAVDDTLDNQPGFVEELLRGAPPPHQGPDARAERRHARPALKTIHQPALRTVAPRKAQSPFEPNPEEDSPMRVLQGIYRYPVKGLSPQPVGGVELQIDKPFPFDRIFALTRPGVPVDAADPQWSKKGLFVMLMLDNALAQVQTCLDVQSLRFDITQQGRRVLSADLGTVHGREAVEAFFKDLVPRLDAPPRLVRSRQGHFMDKPDNVLSLINLATVRSLEAQWGHAIDPLRFRANFYFEGLRPWEEFDWIGSDIQLGNVLCRVDRRNGRCSATNVNPANGQRDLDIPGSLRRDFGHKDLGVYLVVRKGGKVVLGDAVRVPDVQAQAPPGAEAVPPVPGAAPGSAPGAQQHICRGCYFIYDDARGLPQDGVASGTTFADLPAQWTCPDCGTGKATFQPTSGIRA